MKNRPIIIVILFLVIVGYHQFDRYIMKSDSDDKYKKYNETMDYVDSTMILVDEQIEEWNMLENDHNHDQCTIDSLKNKLENPNIKYIHNTEYVKTVEYVPEISHRLEALHSVNLVESTNLVLKDSIQYNIITQDSLIYTYTYDTINKIYVDTILITDPKITKKIKKKYL